MTRSDNESPLEPEPAVDNGFAERLREMNEALLLSSVRQHELVDQLQQAATALAEQDRQKDEFLAMLSHELRNPLAPIANAVQILGLLPDETPVQRAARIIIERQTAHLMRLVDDLLDISRITSGHIRLRVETVDMHDMIEHAVESVRPFMEEHRHQLTHVLTERAIWVEADPARMEQVIINLLNNAAKYTPDGGIITVSANTVGTECVLHVRDTGIGMAPELLPRIFELFMQAERSLDRSQGGLGVGLALVRRLVELHRGRVEAHSAVGVGSEFMVYLPIAQAPVNAIAAHTPNAAVTSERQALRVLVVDDNVDAAESVRILLTALGHDVRTAYAGFAAIKLADSFQPDVAVLDIGLPEVDGYDVAQRIRLQPHNAHVILIALTGYGQDSDRQRSRNAGFDYHLAKPTNLGKLQEILTQVPRQRSGD